MQIKNRAACGLYRTMMLSLPTFRYILQYLLTNVANEESSNLAINNIGKKSEVNYKEHSRLRVELYEMPIK